MIIKNLENEFINFELSDEDLEVIRGGVTVNEPISRISLPPQPCPWCIIIAAYPSEELIK